jgi:REP element-mobilizing transposase RayT
MSKFQPYDPHEPVTQSWRILPHWEQPGATCFVTFRLADSLPAEARARLAELRELDEFDAFVWVEKYLDAGWGSCLLSAQENAEMIASALRYFDDERYKLGAFVVMPNHVHAIIQPIRPHTRSQVVHSWKSYTAHKLQRSSPVHGQVWQDEGFDRIVRDESELRRFHDYVLANPKVARLPAGKYILGEGSARWFHP